MRDNSRKTCVSLLNCMIRGAVLTFSCACLRQEGPPVPLSKDRVMCRTRPPRGPIGYVRGRPFDWPPIQGLAESPPTSTNWNHFELLEPSKPMTEGHLRPLSIEFGTHKTVKTRLWPWIEPLLVRTTLRPWPFHSRSTTGCLDEVGTIRRHV